MNRLRLSVIVAHRNDRYRLRDTCDSLLDNATHPDDYEVIIVDDGSGDHLAALGGKYVHDAAIIKLEKQVGVGAARMIGAARAWGEVLIFTDAHMRFPVGWDQEIRRSMMAVSTQSLICSRYQTDQPHDREWCESDDIAGATMSHFSVKPDPNNMKWSICRLTPLPAKPDGRWLVQVPAVIGACYIIKRDYFNELRGFEGLTGYGGDEQLLSWKVHLSGGWIYCNYGLPTVHLSGGLPSERRQMQDLVPQLVNCLYIERLVGGPQWFAEFAARLPAHLRPLIDQVLSIPIIDYHTDPDAIAGRFGMQTRRQALHLMDEMIHPHRDALPANYYE